MNFNFFKSLYFLFCLYEFYFKNSMLFLFLFYSFCIHNFFLFKKNYFQIIQVIIIKCSQMTKIFRWSVAFLWLSQLLVNHILYLKSIFNFNIFYWFFSDKKILISPKLRFLFQLIIVALSIYLLKLNIFFKTYIFWQFFRKFEV